MTSRDDGFTHLDAQGQVHMVDVGEKPITRRVAIARGGISGQPETIAALAAHALDKGDALATARLAGIMAAKRTDEWIPLCHSIPLDRVDVRFELDPDAGHVRIEAEVIVHAKTGVEMEALVAVQAAALTLYDMCKGRDRALVIEPAYLARKEGGRSGVFEHPTMGR